MTTVLFLQASHFHEDKSHECHTIEPRYLVKRTHTHTHTHTILGNQNQDTSLDYL